MSGSGSVRFSDLFEDTLQTHGVRFAVRYYIVKHGMSRKEFLHWFGLTLR